MKRALVLVGFAFLVAATPAQAQQDGEYQIENEEVRATGNATGGTCDPTNFQLLIDILFGPGNKVETVQGDQRTVGKFDPETGKITTSSGPESYTLEPDGEKRLTGFNTYNDCRWKIDFDLNKPGLVFVQTEAAPEPAASPTVAQEEPAAAVGTSAQEEGGGFPWIPIGVIVFLGGGIFAVRHIHDPRRSRVALDVHRGPLPSTLRTIWSSGRRGFEESTDGLYRCSECHRMFPRSDVYLMQNGLFHCHVCPPRDTEGPTDEDADESMAKELGDALGTGKSKAQLLQEQQEEARRQLNQKTSERLQGKFGDTPNEGIPDEKDR